MSAFSIPASAGRSSLPHVSQGPQPGPPPLYRPLAHAPMLRNSGRWHAKPLMVSGAAAYRGGEFVYQDYLYDDHGANTTDAPADPQPRPGAGDTSFGGVTGDLVYPTDGKRYGYNSADLVELRVKPSATAVAFRFTLDTLLAKRTTAIAVGIDTDRSGTAATDWGHGLGSLGPLGLEHVLFTDGVRAQLDNDAVATSTNLRRNQIEVVVPKTRLDPGRSTWRMYAVTGIADGKGGFATLQDDPDATHPGGAHGTSAPPVFNVAFRFEKQHDEPMGSDQAHSGGRSAGYGNMRDQGQAEALEARDISPFAAYVDFAKLARRANSSALLPRTGYMNRIYVSHINLGEGVAASRPWFLGRLQPYALYVPTNYRRANPAGLLLVLHSLAAAYNQFEVFAPHTYRDLCQERYSICFTGEGRGPDSWYLREGELDVFEIWADVAHRYALDPDRTAITGYSMGGYGTFRLVVSYPDLFSKAFPVVGPPGEGIWVGEGDTVDRDTNTFYQLENFRNVPAFIWNGAVDELVPAAGTARQAQRLDDLGYRYRQDYFSSDHFALSIVDNWERGKKFLGSSHVDRDPARVTFVVEPATFTKKYGLIHDHAYWVWHIRMRSNTGDPPTGFVDVRSLRYGQGDPITARHQGGGNNPLPYVERGISWDGFQKTNPSAGLSIHLRNVKAVTIGLDRAGINGASLHYDVTSDGPATIRFVGGGNCFDHWTIQVGAGQSGGAFLCAVATTTVAHDRP